MLTDGLECCGLLWCFYQLFGLSFWRHPFTAEHPLLRHWCRDTFLHLLLHLGWPESEHIFSKCSFLGELFLSSVCVSQSSGPALNLLLNGKQNLVRNTSIGHKMTFFSFQFACLWWRLRLMRRQLMHVYSENLPHLTDLHHFLTKQCRLLTLIRYEKKSALVFLGVAQINASVFILLKISDHKFVINWNVCVL